MPVHKITVGARSTEVVAPTAPRIRDHTFCSPQCVCWACALVTCVALGGCVVSLALIVTGAERTTIIQHDKSLGVFNTLLPLNDRGLRVFALVQGDAFMEPAPTPLTHWGAAEAAGDEVVAPTHHRSTLLHQGGSLGPGHWGGELPDEGGLWTSPMWELELRHVEWLVLIVAFLILAMCTLPGGKDRALASPKLSAPPPSAAEAEDCIDILEAFDELDRKRQGFVHCAAVRAHLGNPAAESDVVRAVAASTPPFGVIFYADFVRLAQRPGPLATVLAERAARRQRLAAARQPA